MLRNKIWSGSLVTTVRPNRYVIRSDQILSILLLLVQRTVVLSATQAFDNGISTGNIWPFSVFTSRNTDDRKNP